MEITNIQTLLDRETVANNSFTAPLEELKASHADADFTIYPRIIDPNPGEGGCLICECATVGVREMKTRKIVRVCRDIIKTLKLASGVQSDPQQVQIYYKLKYIDDLPILLSQRLPIRNAELKIAAHLMEIDGDDDLVIHDLSHLETQHCQGINCQRKRHPGCSEKTDGAVCPDFVAVVK